RRLGRDVVEGAERVARGLLSRWLVEIALVLGQPRTELLLEVSRAAVRVADRVQLQVIGGHAQTPEQRARQLDHLGVAGRGVGAAGGGAAGARGPGPSAAGRSGRSSRTRTASRAAARGACRARGRRGRWAPSPPPAASASGCRGPRTCTSPSRPRPSRARSY